LEYVEAGSLGNFLGNTSISARKKVQVEIMAELKKYEISKCIESIYHSLFALAEKSLNNCNKKS
jgi:hypothetical protein